MNENEIETKKSKPISKTTIVILLLTVVFLFLRFFVFTPVTVSGESMAKTLEDKDKLLVNKVSNIDRYDIVVFKSTAYDNLIHKKTLGNDYLVKRVIGLPNDTIESKNDVLYVNGKPVDEPYTNKDVDRNQFPLITDNFSVSSISESNKIPKGKYLVLGDNRTNSIDSRKFGLIDESDVIGEVSVRMYPFSKIKYFPQYKLSEM